MKHPANSPALWAERYETLRRYVLEGRQRLPAQPLGLALWLAKGMAGWMRQWSQLLEPAVGPPRPLARPSAVGDPWQEPLTRLLAQITLKHLEPRNGL